MGRTTGYIDIHCHLDLCKDLPQVMNRTRTAEVKFILTHGTNPASNRQSLVISTDYPEVKAALGLYPIDALALDDATINAEIAFIRRHVSDITAIGEVGMDFKEDATQHERQKEIFRKFIQLSQEIKKPLIVHSRHAEQECIELLEAERAKNVVMHCFCGKWKLVERILDNGWFLTIPSNVTFSQQFQHIAKAIPITQLFCETDAPFLHPEKQRDNDPSNVVVSYRTLATLKGVPEEEIQTLMAENWLRLIQF